MTDVRHATAPNATLNWPVILQGLLVTICLLGFSSASGSSWLVYPAIAVLIYALHAGVPIRRLTSPRDLWCSLRRWTLRLLGMIGAVLLAALLSDGSGVLAIVGSLLFILVLAAAGAATVVTLARIGRSSAPSIARTYWLACEHLRLLVRLIWLSVTQ